MEINFREEEAKHKAILAGLVNQLAQTNEGLGAKILDGGDSKLFTQQVLEMERTIAIEKAVVAEASRRAAIQDEERARIEAEARKVEMDKINKEIIVCLKKIDDEVGLAYRALGELPKLLSTPLARGYRSKDGLVRSLIDVVAYSTYGNGLTGLIKLHDLVGTVLKDAGDPSYATFHQSRGDTAGATTIWNWGKILSKNL